MPLCRESTKKSLDVLTTVGLVDLGSITDESVNLLTTGDLGKSIVSYT